jgi:hypothetical protein
VELTRLESVIGSANNIQTSFEDSTSSHQYKFKPCFKFNRLPLTYRKNERRISQYLKRGNSWGFTSQRMTNRYTGQKTSHIPQVVTVRYGGSSGGTTVPKRSVNPNCVSMSLDPDVACDKAFTTSCFLNNFKTASPLPNQLHRWSVPQKDKERHDRDKVVKTSVVWETEEQ